MRGRREIGGRGGIRERRGRGGGGERAGKRRAATAEFDGVVVDGDGDFVGEEIFVAGVGRRTIGERGGRGGPAFAKATAGDVGGIGESRHIFRDFPSLGQSPNTGKEIASIFS